jgi:hypothetical protein
MRWSPAIIRFFQLSFFTLVAVLQLVRAIKGWSVTIGKTSIPLWASWIACVVAAILVWLGFAASQA